MKKMTWVTGLLAGFALLSLAAETQADNTRWIEGQIGIDGEHGFRITLPEGWQFDSIPPIHPCFSFTSGSDPNLRGSISASKRLDNKTARQELDEWLATAQDLMIPGESYEASPVGETRLGGEEAVICAEMFEDERGVVASLNVFAVKGENSYHLLISSLADQYDALKADSQFIQTNLRFQ